MVCCAICQCGNTSTNCNYENNGITFHRFPKDTALKDKWIMATGKNNNWAPTKYSRICSRHFKEEDFDLTTKRRNLYKAAIPTLNIWKLTNITIPEKKTRIDRKLSILAPKSTEPDEDSSSPPSPSGSNSNPADAAAENVISTDTPQTRPRVIETSKILRAAVADKIQIIKKQRLKIKSLQSQVRRDRNKILYLEYLIRVLRDNQVTIEVGDQDSRN